MELWDSLAFFGIDPSISAASKVAFFIAAIVLITIQTLLTLVVKDDRVKGHYDGLPACFNTFFLYIPALALANSIEFFILIQCSFNATLFTVVGIAVMIYIATKALTCEVETNPKKVSLLGLIAWIQQMATIYIIEKGYHYPAQSIISPIRAKYKISNTQKKYLRNV